MRKTWNPVVKTSVMEPSALLRACSGTPAHLHLSTCAPAHLHHAPAPLSTFTRTPAPTHLHLAHCVLGAADGRSRPPASTHLGRGTWLRAWWSRCSEARRSPSEGSQTWFCSAGPGTAKSDFSNWRWKHHRYKARSRESVRFVRPLSRKHVVSIFLHFVTCLSILFVVFLDKQHFSCQQNAIHQLSLLWLVLLVNYLRNLCFLVVMKIYSNFFFNFRISHDTSQINLCVFMRQDSRYTFSVCKDAHCSSAI